jgi:hypothetical protein
MERMRARNAVDQQHGTAATFDYGLPFRMGNRISPLQG